MEQLFAYLLMFVCVGFIVYCVWSLNPKYPERLEKLKEYWGADDTKFN